MKGCSSRTQAGVGKGLESGSTVHLMIEGTPANERDEWDEGDINGDISDGA